MMTIKEIDLGYQDGKLTINSVKIAEALGKQHQKVINDIRNLNFSEEFTQDNFMLSKYNGDIGIDQPIYQLTEVGFVFLLGSYQGKKAINFLDEICSQFLFVGRYIKEVKEIIKQSNNIFIEEEIELCAKRHLDSLTINNNDKNLNHDKQTKHSRQSGNDVFNFQLCNLLSTNNINWNY